MGRGIYRIEGGDECVVAEEIAEDWLASYILDSEDIEDLISGAINLADYDLTLENGGKNKLVEVGYKEDRQIWTALFWSCS